MSNKEFEEPCAPGWNDPVETYTTDSATGRCPKCGAQIYDPFGMDKVVHDVAECNGKYLRTEL